jgi:uncharacterized protein with GYD domain
MVIRREQNMLFVTLLVPSGRGTEAVEYFKTLKPPKNVTIRNIYFTFGRYDGVLIFEAPDVETAMNFVRKIGLETRYSTETLTAVLR